MAKSDSDKVADEEYYGDKNCMVAQAMSSDMFRVSVEKFFCGFEDVPPGFVQSTFDVGTPITRGEALLPDDPRKLESERFHVMIVGPPCTGKSTLVNKIANECTSGKIDIFKNRSTLIFIVSLRIFSGDERISLREFLFREMVLDISEEGKESGFQWMLRTSENVVFMMDALHTVPYQFESSEHERLNIGPDDEATPNVFLHNIFAGNLFPKAKIISCCRSYRAANFVGRLRPHRIIELGELSNQSMKTIMKGYLGGYYPGVYDFWSSKLPRIFLVNKTMGFLRYNMMSCGIGTSYKFTGTIPMAMLNLILSCTHQSHMSTKKDTRPLILPMIHKMKKMAYSGVMEFKYVFQEKEANERFGISEADNMFACIAYPGKEDYRTQILVLKPDNRYYFMDNCIQEFFCALTVAEMKIKDFSAFLDEHIHSPRFRVVRRMVCSLVFDSTVHDVSVREKLLKEPGDYHLQRKALHTSMMEEFHRLKRRDLLEFFHAVHDCNDKKLGLVPKHVKVIDFSHIRLYLRDMLAIGASLSGGVKVEYLNLSNCEISPEGMKVFSDKLLYAGTGIKRFNLDWNKHWMVTCKGTEACAEVIRHCNVQELSINHNDMSSNSFHILDLRLDRCKLKILHLRHNGTLGDEGFNILGDFIIRHRVEKLYASHDDLAAPKRMQKLRSGPKKFVVESGILVDDKAVFVGRLDPDFSD